MDGINPAISKVKLEIFVAILQHKKNKTRNVPGFCFIQISFLCLHRLNIINHSDGVIWRIT